MRRLVVVISAVAMVALGASVAQAQAGKFCPTPETIKFEATGQGTFSGSQGGITVTNGGPDTVVFTIGNEVTITQICVKAGQNASVFNNFTGTSAGPLNGITLSWTCPVVNGNIVGDGTCTVTVTRSSGPGLSHISFYTTAYVAPQAAVAPLTVAQGESAGGGSAAGGLAFTGVQLSLMLAILAGLIVAGTLVWTAGRRRAAKTE